MKLYQISNEFEMNTIDDMSIIYSQDFSQVYQADQIETLILSEFHDPTCVEKVKEIVQKIPQYKESEFDSYIEDLISKEILIVCGE